jgi:hypothetical protein
VIKSNLKSNIINFAIISGLIFLQIMAPAFGFASNALISVATKNNQSYGFAENATEKSCCVEVRLPAQEPVPKENGKHSSTTPCCDENCDSCLFSCCNSSAFMLTSHLPKAQYSLTSSMLCLASVSYISPYLHSIYRPPRA